MPFSGSIFTNVAGATTAVAGDIVQSAVWDAIHTDYATAFTQVLSQVVSEITNRNILWMNGGCEIWQHGAGSAASIAVASATTLYTADRWYLLNDVSLAQVVSAQVGLTSQSNLAARIRRNVGITTTLGCSFNYPLDTDEIIRMRGKIVTFSCVVKAGANWSPTNGTLLASFYVGTGSVSKRGVAFSGETTVLSIATNLTAGGAVTAISGSSSAIVPITSSQAELQFTWVPTGAAGAADDITIDDVQIECQLSAATWTPTNFDRLDFPTMLAGCKRFYHKTVDYSLAPAAGTGGYQNAVGWLAVANSSPWIWWQYPVEMRATAGITTYNPITATNSNWHALITSVDVTVSVDSTSLGAKGVLITGVTATATLLNTHLYYIHLAASAGI